MPVERRTRKTKSQEEKGKPAPSRLFLYRLIALKLLKLDKDHLLYYENIIYYSGA